MSNERKRRDPSPLMTRYSSPITDLARLLPDPVQAARVQEWLPEPLARCPDPEMALANLTRWATHLVSASATFATLEEDPRLLDELLCLFASSQYLADILIREPTGYTLLREPDEAWQHEDLRARMA